MLHCVRLYKNSGFILFFVLIFMQILILLSWYMINNILLETKINQDVLEQHAFFMEAAKTLNEVENFLLNQVPSCIIPITETHLLVSQPLSWWESPVTCTGSLSQFKYYYVAEFLTEDPCATIEQMKAIADYYRITLFFLSSESNRKIFLQSTVAVASTLSKQCKGSSHSVMLGRQSWREI